MEQRRTLGSVQSVVAFVASASFAFCAGCTPVAETPVAPQTVPKVTVTPVVVREGVVNFDEYVGKTEASESVEVRSRVYGFVQSVDFKDGDRVEENRLLFAIEPEEYEAIQKQSQSRIAVSESKLELARTKLARNTQLFKTQAIAREEYEESVAAVREAEAALNAAKADAERSALDVKYTKIRAPIAGRIDRALVSKGDLVIGGQSGGTLLTRIVREQPMYVYFDVDETSLLRYKRMRPADSKAAPGSLRELDIDCFVQLADEKDFPHQGKLDFISNRLDPGTGTVNVRASFKNEDLVLDDGMYVKVRVPVGKGFSALLIPERAIATSLEEKYVYVVEEGVAKRRPIELGPTHGDLRIVTKGLAAGEHVITKGQQRVRPNQKVEAELEPEQKGAGEVSVSAATTEGLPRAHRFSSHQVGPGPASRLPVLESRSPRADRTSLAVGRN